MRPTPTVIALGLVAAAAWLPVLWMSASPDESGYLLVASQWHDGGSLYGDYWVDRPPLLLMIFSLAAAGGGLVALRLLGMVAVFLSVVLAGRVGRLVAPRDPAAPMVAAATTTVFVANPLFGRGAVNGELLALPLVLTGLMALLQARAWSGHRDTTLLWAAAGAAAAAAALVKQNFVEVFLVAAVMLAVPAAGVRRARAGAAFVSGAAAVLSAVLVFAASRGTDPMGLWNAVVSFRLDAGRVIDTAATEATPIRAGRLVVVLAFSGALPLLILGWRRLLRARTADGLDLRLVATVLVIWECMSIAAGGSYWLHYLMALVPGLVVVATLATESSETQRVAWQRSRARALGYAATVAVGALVWVAVFPVQTRDGVTDYLVAHRRTGDTAVVAFGKPDILYRARMSSPYPLIWSLPVRVLDPQLRELARALASADRPTWLITGRAGLSGWGLDPSPQVWDVLERHYRPVAEIDGQVVYRTRGDS
jgi:hypothetical protein